RAFCCAAADLPPCPGQLLGCAGPSPEQPTMPFFPPPTPANELPGDQLAERLAYVFYRFRDRLTPPDWDAPPEAIPRLQHLERPVRPVRPDRVTELEEALTYRPPPG